MQSGLPAPDIPPARSIRSFARSLRNFDGWAGFLFGLVCSFYNRERQLLKSAGLRVGFFEGGDRPSGIAAQPGHRIEGNLAKERHVHGFGRSPPSALTENIDPFAAM